VAQVASAASTVRVSGDNVWIVFHDGERIASGDNWQAPTVTEFDLDKNGRALIAIYVLDVAPGADGVGAMLADIILDDGTYIPTSEDEPGWVCDRGGFDRNGDWVTVAFDDSAWIPLSFFDKFPGGVWGGGAALMTAAFGARRWTPTGPGASGTARRMMPTSVTASKRSPWSPTARARPGGRRSRPRFKAVPTLLDGLRPNTP
jgi:hypothetical protein